MASEPSDDVISLEDLVRDAGAEKPVEAASQGSVDAPQSAAPSEVSEIDSLLEAEDPTFINSMGDLRKQGAHSTSTLADIDPLDLEKLSREKPSKIKALLEYLAWPFVRAFDNPKSIFNRAAHFPKILLPGIIVGIKKIGKSAKTGLGFAAKKLKIEITAFLELPWKSKLIAVIAIGLGVLAVSVLNLTFSRKLEINFRPNFLRSFADLADVKYSYSPNEPMEDFTDPLFHPEHVVLVDKIVVNLRQPRDGSNPMGLFELYFEASNQESAVELKDRDGEVRDVIGRSLEQMNYDELVTVSGKERMKTAIRKNLNTILTRGQVRRVFLKTIVLKP